MGAVQLLVDTVGNTSAILWYRARGFRVVTAYTRQRTAPSMRARCRGRGPYTNRSGRSGGAVGSPCAPSSCACRQTEQPWQEICERRAGRRGKAVRECTGRARRTDCATAPREPESRRWSTQRTLRRAGLRTGGRARRPKTYCHAMRRRAGQFGPMAWWLCVRRRFEKSSERLTAQVRAQVSAAIY